jgi:hypothetical protein
VDFSGPLIDVRFQGQIGQWRFPSGCLFLTKADISDETDADIADKAPVAVIKASVVPLYVDPTAEQK